MRFVFMGTPPFAAKALQTLLDWPKTEDVVVFTQPDKPAGRGLRPQISAVKQVALARGLPVRQTASLKTPEGFALMAGAAPDCIVSAAYGLILPQAVLDLPPKGALNIHASLLPRWRGAAPIQRALLAGDVVTGVTIMQMDAGLDTGPMLLQRSVLIGVDDTAVTLHDQLADLGGRMLIEVLDRIDAGSAVAVPQDDARAVLAPKLKKEEGRLDFTQAAVLVHSRVRAMHPWPGAFTDFEHGKHNLRLTLAPGRLGPNKPADLSPGAAPILVDDALAFPCADRLYLVTRIKPEGRPEMDGRAFYNGYVRNA